MEAGVLDAVEQQVLTGDGTGENFDGVSGSPFLPPRMRAISVVMGQQAARPHQVYSRFAPPIRYAELVRQHPACSWPVCGCSAISQGCPSGAVVPSGPVRLLA